MGMSYDNLSENVKELDRAFVRYVRHVVIEDKRAILLGGTATHCACGRSDEDEREE